MGRLKRLATPLAAAASGPWLRSPLGRENHLRVLAYHEIRDAKGFEYQMAHLVSRYRPVTAVEVVDAIEGKSVLPPRSVWVTFDDGDPTVVDIGLPILNGHGVQAVAFVCPSVIDSSEPLWWQVVDGAARHGLVHRGALVSARTRAHLKTVDDKTRRREVDEIRRLFEETTGSPILQIQISTVQLEQWIADGHAVGNHTWDHPLLNQCSPNEQERQITLAHEWFVRTMGLAPRLFAFPNGNATSEARVVLASLGYELAVKFDHRLADLASPLAVSRLRVTADSDLGRFRAIVAGLHPWFHRAIGRS